MVLTLGIIAAVTTARPMETRAAVDAEFQIWTAAFIARNRSKTGYSYWLDLHARRSPDSVVAIVRPGLGYRFNRQWVLHGGYGWIPAIADSGEAANEHQLWQHVIWTPEVGPTFGADVRFRIEERLSDLGSGVGIRGRLLVRGGVQVEDTPLSFVAWDEFFANFNDAGWGPEAGFDENRIFAGLGLGAPPVFRVEVGYLSIITRIPDQNDRLQNNLAVNLIVTP